MFPARILRTLLHEQSRTLTSEQIEAIGRLAPDLPALWSAATTTVMDRKAILRAVIERIILRVIDHSERVQVDIFWVGGCVTQDVVCWPVQRVEQLSYYAQVCAEVRLGAQEGETVLETVARLNALGWRPPRGGRWGSQAVQELTCQLGLRRKQRRRAYGGWDGRDGCWGRDALSPGDRDVRRHLDALD